MVAKEERNSKNDTRCWFVYENEMQTFFLFLFSFSLLCHKMSFISKKQNEVRKEDTGEK